MVQAKTSMDEELQEAQERIEAEGAAQKSFADKVENLSRELEIMRVELTAARQNVEKAEFDKNKVTHPCLISQRQQLKHGLDCNFGEEPSKIMGQMSFLHFATF